MYYNNLRQIIRISGLSRAKARLAGTRLSENILSSNPFAIGKRRRTAVSAYADLICDIIKLKENNLPKGKNSYA